MSYSEHPSSIIISVWVIVSTHSAQEYMYCLRIPCFTKQNQHIVVVKESAPREVSLHMKCSSGQMDHHRRKPIAANKSFPLSYLAHNIDTQVTIVITYFTISRQPTTGHYSWSYDRLAHGGKQVAFRNRLARYLPRQISTYLIGERTPKKVMATELRYRPAHNCSMLVSLCL